jgi:type VI secretion system secreted protein Hcp
MKFKRNPLIPGIFVIIIIGVVLFTNLNLSLSSDTTTNSDVDKTIYMFLNLKGETQGDIVGSTTLAGHEGAIEVLSYSHSITSPRDPASGLPTGKRQHKPIVITKEIDKSTPLLYFTLINNELITGWKLEFWKTSSTGILVMFYSIELLDASIADIADRGSNFGATESIAFCYRKIVWTWIEGGITSQDDWEAPVV